MRITTELIGLVEKGRNMDKKMTSKIKGVAILIMLLHHFIEIPFSEFPIWVRHIGAACKICVALYAVLSGYGYFFAREKTVQYGLKKIFGLLQIYWIFLFTLFLPAAIRGGGKYPLGSCLFRYPGLTPP